MKDLEVLLTLHTAPMALVEVGAKGGGISINNNTNTYLTEKLNL